MNSLLIGLLGAVLATNQAVAVSNLVAQTTGISVSIPDPNDPVEKDYLKLLADDDAAQSDADRWISENRAFAEKGAGISDATLTLRIRQRFDSVDKEYEDFLALHPGHVRARLAYGSFLNDTGKETEAKAQWEKARELDPKNPAAWNNLANYYGHRGPVTNAFTYYQKAIELNPKEPVYYQNLATTTFLFRRDAMQFYNISEQQVFDRSLDLYRKALQLDPENFVLATDLAQTYYGIKPPRNEDALAAWKYALKVAGDDFQREGIYIHLARIELNSGQLAEARQHLDLVTNATYQVLKQRLLRNLAAKENPSATNTVPR
ncbi:MAG: tetratricopeptide repeat protein [Candidatus Omnitrophica bacterium]|nr:tetratricopeptide repeat protein [Candidatus Omnitrophota bacterium]